VSGRFDLLPNVRSGVVDAAGAPAAGGARRELSLRVEVLANGAPVPAAGAAAPVLEVKGAGDVVALDPGQIATREPKPGSSGVEPNYFPYVELVDADLPWRHSLDVAPGPRRRPWLVLITLTADEFQVVEPGSGPLPALRVASPSRSLPPLAQSWAWAHVQVQRDSSASFDLDRALRERPETHFARILCPRRLRDGTAYTLFLVPTFEAGRLRGLGLAGPASPWDAPAWDASSSAPVDLPWYDRWTITTSALDDIESMIRRLRPEPAEGVPLTRTVDASRPGHLAGFSDPGRSFEAEGALRSLGFEPVRAPHADTPLTAPLAARLEAALADESVDDDGADHEDPLVALPAWGAAHAGTTEIAGPSASPPRGVAWVNEANLDLRNRFAAGSGARVVRRHQEEFCQQAWEQVGELLAANRLRARLQLAERLAARLVERHLMPLAPEAVLSLAEPLRPVVALGAGARTLQLRLEQAGLPSGYATLALRRVAARRAAPRVGASGGAATRAPLAVILPRASVSARGAGAPRAGALAAIRPARADAARAWTEQVFPGLPADAIGALSPAAPPPGVLVEVGALDVPGLREAIGQTLRRLPLDRARAEIVGLPDDEAGTLEPVFRGPRLVEPLSTFLAHEAPEVFLPGAGQIPYDTIVLLEENPRFVESFLAGANDEMRRELVYREFPFEPRASTFTRFWDRGSAPDDAAGDDVPPLDQWNAALGSNATGGAGPRLVVLVRGELARRFPGFMVALNHQQLGGGSWSPTAGTTVDPLFWGSFGEDKRYFGFALTAPEVKQQLASWFVVVYEPPGRVRFGLDIQTWQKRQERRSLQRVPLPFGFVTASGPRTRGFDVAQLSGLATATDPAPITVGPATWDDLSWDHVRLTSGGYVDFDVLMSISSDPADGAWGPSRTSASLARTMFQHPVRVVVPATKLL